MRYLFVTALVMAVTACSSSGTGGNTGGGSGGSTGGGSGGSTGGSGGTGDAGPIPLASFCDRQAAAICQRDVRCNAVDSTNLALCVARTKAQCEDTSLRVSNGAHVGYDAAQATRCVAAQANFPCAKVGPQFGLPECNAVFTGQGTPGQACSSFFFGPNFQTGTCGTGWCRPAQNACSTCTAFQTVGQACDLIGQVCDPKTSYCPVDDGGLRLCQAFKAADSDCSTELAGFVSPCADLCTKRGDAGLRCGPSPLGDACEHFYDCAATAYCKGLVVYPALTPGVCTARKALSASCINEQQDDGCADAGTCLDGICKPGPFFTRTVGQECEFSGQCVDSAYCKDETPADGGGHTGHCTARIAAGSSCSDLFNDDPCVHGAFCSSLTGGTCVALNAAGGTCSGPYGCKQHLSCFRPDGGFDAPGTCRLPVDAGAFCSSQQGIICGAESSPKFTCLADGISGAYCGVRRNLGSVCDIPTNCDTFECFNRDGGTQDRTCQAACF